MKLAEVSIKRPVFTTMIIVAIIVFGGFLYSRLAVDMFPDVDFPVVTITVIYPGADPETMESQVAEPIEEAVNSLGSIRALRSVCLESVTQVFIEFELEVDPNVASQDVRDRVASIVGDLPDGAEAPIVEKLDLGAAPIVRIALSGGSDPTTLARFAEDVLKPGLERISGVGQVELIGNRTREVHVYVDPAALRSRGLTVMEVAQALGAQNVDIPGGRIQRGSEELVLRTDARATSVEDLERLAIATIPMGGVIRLSDVARVVDGFEERRSLAEVDGSPALAVVVRKQSGANTVAVAEAVREALPELEAQAPPGATVGILLDNSAFIASSIETVEFDLVLGAFLAVAIIFIFLRDPRATLISALALPTSVVGTFAFVSVMGFSINMLTTLALSLSIGILIDDAIVVIENIVRRRTTLGESPKEAAYRGTSEIGLAVLATTMSIVAVFVPVALIEGMIGKFFYEFGLTVAFAVLLSLFVSFTLTPMLSSRLLREHREERGLSLLVDNALKGLESIYRAAVTWALRHRFVTATLALATLGGAVMLAPLIGLEFMPAQDRGQFTITVEMPPGTGLEETASEARAVAEMVRQVPGVDSTFTTIGGGVRQQVNTSEILVSLIHRDGRAYHETEVHSHIRRLLEGRPDRVAVVEGLPLVGVAGVRMAPVQVDLRGDDLDELSEQANRLANRLRETPGFVDVDTTFRAGKPELRVEVDRGQAADVGVLGAQIAMTVRVFVAGQVASRFDGDGDRYDIRVQLDPQQRTSTATAERAQVRNPLGELIDVGAVATVVEDTSPSQIDRANRQRQITVYANLAEKPLGEALDEVAGMLGDLPHGVTYAFGGMGKVFEEATGSLMTALILAIICVYMILAAQFESFVHPLTIMMSLPFSVVGAFGALIITGSQMHILAMIGFIMLMGLVTKNAILLVDFANQRRAAGLSREDALVEAGVIRLRPILMTTAAMIFGMIPVAIGHGESGEMRAPMGIVVIGGLITSTVLTLLVVPVIYTFMDGLANAAGAVRKKLGKKPKDEPSSSQELAQESEQ